MIEIELPKWKQEKVGIVFLRVPERVEKETILVLEKSHGIAGEIVFLFDRPAKFL